MKVLHVFDHSLPHHSGYSFRSASIIRALNDRDIETLHLTGPKHVHNGLRKEVVDGLEFHRCPVVISGSSPVDQLRCVRHLRQTLTALVREHQPDIIHCHSPCLNGLGALGLGVPVIYEVRACWEDAAVSSGTTTEGSVRYRLSRALETFVARRASELVVICEGLRDEFVNRGLTADRIHVVGNAVNPSSLPAIDLIGAEGLRKSLGLTGRTVIGYFGSFYDYEGLELLVQRMPAILEAVPNVALVLAGGGEAEEALRCAVDRLGLASHVKIMGRVPHEQMGSCYGLADVMVFPRLRQKLTDMVTPLKPLEAMYLERPVVASDVGGHRELIEHEATGLLFKAGDAQALEQAVIRALTDAELVERMKASGRKFVLAERSWPRMAERYEGIYQQAISQTSPAASSRQKA